jgi:LacI family transcriptional regulator
VSITIHDVAKRAGVGIGTVSSVLNNSRPVSDVTRQKVVAAIAELGFVPNPTGRRLSQGKTGIIAVIIPSLSHLPQTERLQGAMSVIGKSDYELSLYMAETVSQRNQILQTILHRGRIDGLLIFSSALTESDVQRIRQHKIPTVLIGAYHPELYSITLDNAAAARTAVRYLVDLGHRRIAYISEYIDESLGFPVWHHRYQGYCQALEEANLLPQPDYYCQGSCSFEQSRQKAMGLLKLANPPTAIITDSDKLVVNILEAAREMSLTIPPDLSIISFEDTELAQAAQLTAVQQHLFNSGRQGIELLVKIIGNPGAERSPIRIQLPIELVIRRTTARPMTKA